MLLNLPEGVGNYIFNVKTMPDVGHTANKSDDADFTQEQKK